MNNNFNYNIQFTINGSQVSAVVKKVGSDVGGVGAAVDKVKGKTNSWLKDMKDGLRTLKMESALNQIDRVAQGLNQLSAPGMAFTTSMADLHAMTGVTGKKLQEIEGYARGAAKTFGGSAAQGVESYKLILGQLTPEIAKTPAALKNMGESVAVTSKLMGGDATAATEVLTTAMNQYQVSLDDPMAASREMANMMNIMAAAAGEGSAELPQIKAALEQSGMAAKMANVSFAETNAAIQVLDKAGKKGSEGGVALRNTLSTLSQGRFLPKDTRAELAAAGVSISKLADTSRPLADRLQSLKPIMNDAALMTKLFGKENSNAAVALLSGLDSMRDLTDKVTGTKTAYEQAAIIMDSPAEKASRITAKIEDLKISLMNGTNGWLGYAGVVGEATQNLTNLTPAVALVGRTISFLVGKQRLQALWTSITTVATSVWQATTAALSATMWSVPIVWIVAAIAALVAIIGYVIYKTDGWGEAWHNVVTAAKFMWAGFVDSLKLQWLFIQDVILTGIDLVKKAWYGLQSLWDEDGAAAAVSAIDRESQARKREMINTGESMVNNVKGAVGSTVAAGKALHWNSDRSLSDMFKSTKEQLGIAPPVTQGAAAATAGAGTTQGGNAGKSATEAIATGGTKNNYITIHIGKQIETVIVQASDERVGKKLAESVVDELNRALAMAGAIGDNN